jgi:predicted dehydrogenase
VSCSYGPGRYDPDYEEQGKDYPVGFVRWTEQRNFEAILDMMSLGQLDVTPLITHRYEFAKAKDAYTTLTDDPTALGIVLDYSSQEISKRKIDTVTLSADQTFTADAPIVGFVGAGNYASRMLIPAFKKGNAQLHTIATSGGVSGVIHGEKNQFAHATTDTSAMLANADINTVAIVTRHSSHAQFVSEALQNGKNVFVEKPLAINRNQLENVKKAYETNQASPTPSRLMVGFNRRFAPHVVQMKQILDTHVKSKSIVMTVNAGAIPSTHWTQDKEVGGGRIIGEACHFIDLIRFLVGHRITNLSAHCLSEEGKAIDDTAVITMNFVDGSLGTVHYFANGATSYPKERIETFCDGKILQLDNFRKLRSFGYKGFKDSSLWQQDKGHNDCAAAFLEAVQNGLPSPIPADELFEVAEYTLQAAEQLT